MNTLPDIEAVVGLAKSSPLDNDSFVLLSGLPAKNLFRLYNVTYTSSLIDWACQNKNKDVLSLMLDVVYESDLTDMQSAVSWRDRSISEWFYDFAISCISSDDEEGFVLFWKKINNMEKEYQNQWDDGLVETVACYLSQAHFVQSLSDFVSHFPSNLSKFAENLVFEALGGKGESRHLILGSADSALSTIKMILSHPNIHLDFGDNKIFPFDRHPIQKLCSWPQSPSRLEIGYLLIDFGWSLSDLIDHPLIGVSRDHLMKKMKGYAPDLLIDLQEYEKSIIQSKVIKDQLVGCGVLKDSEKRKM